MSKMIKCKACGEMISDSENFCPECGKPLGKILDQYMEPSGSSDVEPASGMKGNNILGNLDVAGTKITTDAYSEDHSVDNSRVITDNSSVQSTVYNQTVIDESKKTVTCDVSGRKVLVTNSCQCPSCGRTVATQYFLGDKLRCSQCEGDAEARYKEFYTKLIECGGVLDASMRDILDKKAEELKLSEKQKNEIEFILRKSSKKQLSTKLSGIRQKEFDRIIQLLKKREISVEVAVSKLRDIRKSTQDENCHFIYYTLLACHSPADYFAELQEVNVDVYWQQYWAFLAALADSNVDAAVEYIDGLKVKYVDKSNDINFAEIMLLYSRYDTTGDELYLTDLVAGLKLLIGVDSRQLEPLYRRLCVKFIQDSSTAKGLASQVNAEADWITPIIFPSSVVETKPTAKLQSESCVRKGIVLDDSVATPLVVESSTPPRATPPPVASTPSKSKGNMVGIVAIVAAAVIAIGAFLLWNQGDSSASVATEGDVAAQVDESDAKSNQATATEVASTSNDKETTTTTPASTTQTTTTSSSQSMASKASSDSVGTTQNTQATTLFNQAESAYRSEDYATAVKLYTSSANLGSKSACLKLSEIYTSGAGSISANAMRAKMWSDKAQKLN